MKLHIMALMLLAGCVPQMQPAPKPAPTTCAAPQLQGLLGQPATKLQVMRFASQVRIILRGTAVTMDYLENRLNIEIDADENISRVYCG